MAAPHCKGRGSSRMRSCTQWAKRSRSIRYTSDIAEVSRRSHETSVATLKGRGSVDSESRQADRTLFLSTFHDHAVKGVDLFLSFQSSFPDLGDALRTRSCIETEARLKPLRSLAVKNMHTLCLVFPCADSPLYATLLTSIERLCLGS